MSPRASDCLEGTSRTPAKGNLSRFAGLVPYGYLPRDVPRLLHLHRAEIGSVEFLDRTIITRSTNPRSTLTSSFCLHRNCDARSEKPD